MATKEQKSAKIFYGWWVVLATSVGLSLNYYPIIVVTFGVFLSPSARSLAGAEPGSLWRFPSVT